MRWLPPLRAWLLLLALVPAAASCNKVLPDAPAPGVTSDALTRETHGAHFPIGNGSYHVAQTCDDCHGGFSDFKQFTCVSCHPHDEAAAAARHVFITGYRWDSNACYTCHPNGREATISVVDHSAKYFPIDTGPHAALQCGDCHAWKTTSRPFTCQGCHAHDQDVLAPLHASITGYRYDSNGCFGCHPNGGEAPIAASDHSARFFPIQSGSHNAGACTDCHTDVATLKSFVCTSCHTQSATATQHATVSAYSWGDAGCYSCHPKD
jgi:hypothetical protein